MLNYLQPQSHRRSRRRRRATCGLTALRPLCASRHLAEGAWQNLKQRISNNTEIANLYNASVYLSMQGIESTVTPYQMGLPPTRGPALAK
jgi:hypothetical protein